MTAFFPHSAAPRGLSNPQADAPQAADLLVVGAGAAGLMCAREAAGRGLRVTLLERNAAPGRKLAVCGGGKANFSNLSIRPQDYRCGDAEGVFCVSALRAFTPERLLHLVRAWGLPFEERAQGRLFLKGAGAASCGRSDGGLSSAGLPSALPYAGERRARHATGFCL